MFCLQNKAFLIPLWIMLGLTLSQAHAAGKNKNSKNEVVDIKARYVLLDEKKGISKYKGNVIFSKNTLVIKADTITLYFKKEKLNRALITGSPADVQHQPENEDKVHSQANSMEFFITEDRLLLKGNAFVNQGDRHFSGESIEYDTRQQTITASGSENEPVNSKSTEIAPPKGRVHVIIGPKEEDNDSTGEDVE